MKVEGQVMGSSSENILKQSFGGVYSNELLAEGGSLYSERPEPFSYISVEVGVLFWLLACLLTFLCMDVLMFVWWARGRGNGGSCRINQVVILACTTNGLLVFASSPACPTRAFCRLYTLSRARARFRSSQRRRR